MRNALVPFFCAFFMATGFFSSGQSIQETSTLEAFQWSDFKSQPQQALRILEELNNWRNQSPSETGKKLRVVYFHPKDREPLKDYAKRWDGIMSDIQDFFRTEMKRLAYDHVSMGLERENKMLKIHKVRGSKGDKSYTYKSGGEIRKEVFQALRNKNINPETETLLIVCGLSRTQGKKVTIYSPYYGMGADHNKGICFTADMEWLSVDGLRPDPNNIILQVKEHRDYEPFPLGRFNTVYIGGTIHELGHGLSLPHNLATKEQAKWGTALMGAGNYTYRKEWRTKEKGSFLTHSSAIRLLVHPLFSETTKQSKDAPKLSYDQLDLAWSEEKIHIQGKIHSAVPVVAMIAYNDAENKGQRGYMVNNNYDATSWTSVLSPNHEFRLEVGDLGDGNHQIRILSVHANGATVTKRIHYSMKDGIPSFDRARREIQSILNKKH